MEGDVHHQSGESGRAGAHADLGAPAAGLRRGGPRRGGLFAGQIRHPHRVAAAAATGRGQWLDRGHHGQLHHSGHGAGRVFG